MNQVFSKQSVRIWGTERPQKLKSVFIDGAGGALSVK